jgi:hypothetical protein
VAVTRLVVASIIDAVHAQEFVIKNLLLPNATALGCNHTAVVATTKSVVALIIDTLFQPRLATATLPFQKAIWNGVLPTVIVEVTKCVVLSNTFTCHEAEHAT